VLALLIGGVTVMKTMIMAVFERRSEFALMLAVNHV
jgi:ABC-type antimicrobial peptide transport system permease subunit